MSDRTAPPDRPIIDVEAFERVPAAGLACAEEPHTRPDPVPLGLPRAMDPMQLLHAQRQLLREQQQVLRDMLLGLESPPRPHAAPTPAPYTDLITRSMVALDRSLGTIMHSLEHTFGAGRGDPRSQDNDR